VAVCTSGGCRNALAAMAVSGMEDGSRKDVEMSEPARQSQGSEKTVSSGAIDISPLTKAAGFRSKRSTKSARGRGGSR